MFTEVVLVVAQLRTADAPGAMVLGCALKTTVGAGPAVVTLTTVDDRVVPPGPVAVAVYVVVATGVTFTEPVAGNVPSPLMLTVVAFFAFQLNTVDVPLATVPGCAASEIEGCSPFCADIDPPPHAVAAIKIVNKKTNAVMRRKN